MKNPSDRRFNVFFRNGIGVYSGAVPETKLHTHHATEIIFSSNTSYKVADENGLEKEYHVSLIPHDIKHRFIGDPTFTPIFIYLDPFHYLSQQLKSVYQLDTEIVSIDKTPELNITENLNFWAQGKDVDIIKVITELVCQLTGHFTHAIQLEDRILQSTEHIKSSMHSEIRLSDMASRVHLSESRYAHLFKEQVGIPFRRFVLWTRLQTTVESILVGNSLTSACYDGGFSDLPHFSKTFMDMFGVSPSSVLKG